MNHYIISDIQGTTYSIYAHHVTSDNDSDDSIYFYGTAEGENDYILVAQFTKANIVGFYLTTDTSSDGKSCDTCKYEKFDCDEYPSKVSNKNDCTTCKYYDNTGLFPCGGCDTHREPDGTIIKTQWESNNEN